MIKKLLTISTAIFAILALCSCNSSEDDNEHKKLITFHVGAKGTFDSGIARETVVLPLSGFSIITNKEQFMYNGDLVKADLAQVNDVGGIVKGFYFTCQERGAKRLMQATGANMGSFIVVKYDGTPIGARKIDTTITDGKVFIVSEVPEKDLEKMLKDLNAAIEKINEIKKENAQKW